MGDVEEGGGDPPSFRCESALGDEETADGARTAVGEDVAVECDGGGRGLVDVVSEGGGGGERAGGGGDPMALGGGSGGGGGNAGNGDPSPVGDGGVIGGVGGGSEVVGKGGTGEVVLGKEVVFRDSEEAGQGGVGVGGWGGGGLGFDISECMVSADGGEDEVTEFSCVRSLLPPGEVCCSLNSPYDASVGYACSLCLTAIAPYEC